MYVIGSWSPSSSSCITRSFIRSPDILRMREQRVSSGANRLIVARNFKINEVILMKACGEKAPTSPFTVSNNQLTVDTV